MSRIAQTLCWAAVTTCATSGWLRCQDLRVVDSYAWSAAAYDETRGRIVAMGWAGELCEVDGVAVRHLPVPRLPLSHASATGLITYVFGGLVRDPDGRSLMHVGSDGLQVSASLFDGVSWQPHTGGSPAARRDFVLACDEARHEVLLFGGVTLMTPTTLGETWTFDGTTWTHRLSPSAPSARSSAVAAYDAARACIVLFGGTNNVGWPGFSDTWEWNGATWSAASPSHVPPGRSSPGLAYDSARGRIVMFGGRYPSGVLGDTWEYDGIDWHAMQPQQPLPSARVQSQLVFDPARGETVLLGGRDMTHDLRDVWTWNGVRWQPLPVPPAPRPHYLGVLTDPAGTGLIAPHTDGLTSTTWRWDASGWTQLAATPPPPRAAAATAADATRAFLFGGSDPSLSVFVLNDLWSFDGTNWSLLATGGPSPRACAAMACDLVSGHLVLFGGLDLNNVPSGDTWTFDGVAWTQRQPASAPSARSLASATYDLGRQRVVLFGGNDLAGLPLTDTWEWDGATWAQVASATAPQAYGGALSLAYDLQRGCTVLVESLSGPPWLRAWSLEASGWVPVAMGQTDTAFAIGYKRAHGFPYVNGLLLTDWHNVYSLSTQQAEVERYGVACSATAAALMANSWPRLGAADFAVEVVGGPANSFVALVGAVQSASLPVGGCTLLVQPGQLGVLLGTSGAGFVRAPLPVPAAYGLLGTELFFQAASLEASAPAGFTMSRGLHLRIGH